MNIYKMKLNKVTNKEEISKHLGFVISTARKFCRRNNCYYLLEDVVQSGTIGLIKAVQKFDSSKGFKFTTYAIKWIKVCMMAEVQNQNLIQLPRNTIIDDKQYIPTLSYDNPDNSDIVDLESLPSQINTVQKTFLSLLTEALNKRLKEILDEVELQIIQLKYYKECSFSQIGSALGFTKQRIHQKEKIILNKLKNDIEIQNLYPLYMEY